MPEGGGEVPEAGAVEAEAGAVEAGAVVAPVASGAATAEQINARLNPLDALTATSFRSQPTRPYVPIP